MINEIAEKLSAHEGLSAWQIRRVKSRSNQLFLVAEETESRRTVETERYAITVFVEREAEGKKVLGESEFLFIPGEELKPKVESAAAMAALVANEPFTLPMAGHKYEIPDTVDKEIVGRPNVVIDRVRNDIVSAVSGRDGLCLSAAEIYATHREIAVANSLGLGVEREETELYAEFVLFAGKGCDEVEVGTSTHSRFYETLKMGELVGEYAGYALDNLDAQLPPTGRFDVVFSGEALDTLFNWFIAQTGGGSKYQRWSVFEEGRPVIENPEGELLTLASNPLLPGGMRTRAFDEQGLPLGRVEVIKDGVFAARTASKRYADYLGIPATGDFANVEVTPGAMSKDDLLKGGPLLHLFRFSTFEPNGVTGSFSGEIRNGYLIENGRMTAIKGGAVTGTMQDAFRRAYFSRETVRRESYSGPAYVKLRGLDIGGE